MRLGAGCYFNLLESAYYKIKFEKISLQIGPRTAKKNLVSISICFSGVLYSWTWFRYKVIWSTHFLNFISSSFKKKRMILQIRQIETSFMIFFILCFQRVCFLLGCFCLLISIQLLFHCLLNLGLILDGKETGKFMYPSSVTWLLRRVFQQESAFKTFIHSRLSKNIN